MSDRSFRSRSMDSAPTGASNNTMLIIVSVIIVVLLLVVIFATLWSSTKNNKPKYECTEDSHCPEGQVCQNTKCVVPPPCTGAPTIPTGVTVTFDALANTANISWNTCTDAVSYNVYRSMGNPAVSKTSYDEVISTTTTSYVFSSLSQGTHYFAVTAVNACGESDEASSTTYAPSCTVIPATPSAPLLMTNVDNCSGVEQVEEVDIQVTEATGVAPLNIVKGNGQKKIDSYFALAEAPSGDFPVFLACSASPVEYTLTHVTDAEAATLISPTGPLTLGNTLTIEWSPLMGAEEYAVSCVSMDSDGVMTFVGGTVASPATSMELTVDNGADLAFVAVYGYKYCDKSLESAGGYHITPAANPPP